MKQPTITASARVQVTVEIDAGQPWGGNCSVDQVYSQAKESALQRLTQALKPGEHGIIRIVGEPRVLGVFTEPQK